MTNILNLPTTGGTVGDTHTTVDGTVYVLSEILTGGKYVWNVQIDAPVTSDLVTFKDLTDETPTAFRLDAIEYNTQNEGHLHDFLFQIEDADGNVGMTGFQTQAPIADGRPATNANFTNSTDEQRYATVATVKHWASNEFVEDNQVLDQDDSDASDSPVEIVSSEWLKSKWAPTKTPAGGTTPASWEDFGPGEHIPVTGPSTGNNIVGIEVTTDGNLESLVRGTIEAGTSIDLYAPGTTYSIDDIVRSSGDLLYRSITNSNTGNALTNVQHWLSLGGATQFTPNPVTSTHFDAIGIPNDTIGANLILSKNNLLDGLSPTPNRSVEIFGTGGINVTAHGARDVIEINGSDIGPGDHITTSGTGPNVVGVDKTGDNVTNLQLGTISAGAETLNDLSDVDDAAKDTNHNVLFYNPTSQEWFASDSFTRLVHSVDTLKEQINLISHSVTSSTLATRVNDALRSIVAVDGNPTDDAEYDYVHNQLLWRVSPQTNANGTFVEQAQAANAYREAGGIFAVSKNALPNDAALVVDANDVYYFRLSGFQSTGGGSDQFNVIAQLVDITQEDNLISDYAFSSGTAALDSWFFNINNVVFDHMTAVDAGSGIVGITDREAQLLGYLDTAAVTANNGDYLTVDSLGAIVATDAPAGDVTKTQLASSSIYQTALLDEYPTRAEIIQDGIFYVP